MPPASVRFRCPSCDKALRTTADRAGRELPCPGCGARITVPAAQVEGPEAAEPEPVAPPPPPPPPRQIGEPAAAPGRPLPSWVLEHGVRRRWFASSWIVTFFGLLLLIGTGYAAYKVYQQKQHPPEPPTQPQRHRPPSHPTHRQPPAPTKPDESDDDAPPPAQPPGPAPAQPSPPKLPGAPAPAQPREGPPDRPAPAPTVPGG